MYALFINISVRNWHFTTEEGKALRFLIKPVYCMTWIWALHRAQNKLKSPIEEDNIWVTLRYEPFNLMVANFKNSKNSSQHCHVLWAALTKPAIPPIFHTDFVKSMHAKL